MSTPFNNESPLLQYSTTPHHSIFLNVENTGQAGKRTFTEIQTENFQKYSYHRQKPNGDLIMKAFRGQASKGSLPAIPQVRRILILLKTLKF